LKEKGFNFQVEKEKKGEERRNVGSGNKRSEQ
jgi:hypothetical protein